jgi:polar amino acid transport system substrate-binding protein
MKLKFKFISLFFVLVMTTFVSSCSKQVDVYAKIVKYKTIVIGTESTYPPYEFLDKDGNLQGLDIEIAKLIAKAIGEKNNIEVKVKFKDMSFEGLLGALQSQQIDMIAAAYSITEDRSAVVDFSNVYIEEKPVILVKADTDITELSQLEGKKISAQLGTTMASIAEEYVAKGSTVTTLTKNADLIMQLKVGIIDCVIVESTVAANYTKGNNDIKVATASFASSEDGGYAFAINKNQPELLSIINSVIDELKTSGKIGELFENANELAAQ